MKKIAKMLQRRKVTILAVIVALTVAGTSTAYAANGGNFILGVLTNSATAITQLSANIANPALKIVNNSTGLNATALQLQTAATKPPMTVNSKTKVANLNADSVDGKDSTAFATGTGGKANDADKLDGLDSSQLPGTIANVGSFAGFVGTIPRNPAGDSTHKFAGPTTTVTTTADQRLVGSAQAPLGLSSGSQRFVYGLCYQPSAGGTISNFVGGNYSIGELSTTRMSYAASASVVPGAGTWKVGFCVHNYNTNPSDINDNDFVNGWVQVVNQSPTSAAAAVKAENMVESERSDKR